MIVRNFLYLIKKFLFLNERVFFFSKLRDRNQNTLRKRKFFVSTRHDRNDCDFFQKNQFRNDEKKKIFKKKNEFRNELLFFKFFCLYLFFSHVYYFA